MTPVVWRDPGPVLQARSVGIVGASPQSRWLPIFLEQIPQAGFHGPLFLINPNYSEINGHKCYSSVLETPELVEHALILVPAPKVLDLVREASRAGIKGVTIYSTGWGESGEEGQRRQDELRNLVEETGIRVCGPNCLGFISVREGLIAYPLRILPWLRPGGTGVVLQSGAMLYPLIRAGGERGMGFSHIISCGNEVGLDVADYMKFLIEDANTFVIALLIEGVRNPEKFVAACEMALQARKPVAALKIGLTEKAKASSLSHTGALAGSSQVFQALCQKYGLTQCFSLDDLLESVRALAQGSLPEGRRAGILLFSGALRGLTLDLIGKQGMEIAELSPETIATLADLAPVSLAIPNPVDTGSVGATDHKSYMVMAQRILEDDGVDLLLVEEHAPDPVRKRDPLTFKSLASKTGKPLLVFSEVSFSTTPYASEFFQDMGVPFLQGADRAMKAARDLVTYAERARRFAREGVQRPARTLEMHQLDAPPALPARPGLYGLGIVGNLVENYGLPIVPGKLTQSEAEASAAADELGYPVALKVESRDIAHKSDVGGVQLGIWNRDELHNRYNGMLSEIRRKATGAHLEGVLVQKMASPGLEMSIGVQRDSQFGLVLMVGLGGFWVEILQDVSFRLLPADEEEAWSMVKELRAFPLLQAFRGSPAKDIAALVKATVALSRFAWDCAARLVSVEINPLLLYEEGQGAKAVDTRLLLQ